MNTEKHKCVECKWCRSILFPCAWSDTPEIKHICGYYESKRNVPYWVISQIHYIDIATYTRCAAWAPKHI